MPRFLPPSISSDIPDVLFCECLLCLAVLIETQLSPGVLPPTASQGVAVFFPASLVFRDWEKEDVLLALLCLQTSALSLALMLMPANHHHLTSLVPVIFVIPHPLEVLALCQSLLCDITSSRFRMLSKPTNLIA